MKITIRKKDSVTSAVLFIYNILSETRNESFMRLDNLLELIQFFGKSETSIRTSLSRMVASGILLSRKQGNQTYFDLSQTGARNIALWNKGLTRFFSRYSQKSRGWSGQWNVLSVADFNKSDYGNTEILDDLYECGLRELNNNVWATPYQIEEVLGILRVAGFHYYSFSGSLSSDIDMTTLVNDAFYTAALKQKFSDFLQKAHHATNIIGTKSGEELLPLLFNIGWDFHDIVTADPVLPNELSDMREEDEAVEIMKKIRQAALEEIVQYLKAKNS